MVDRLADLVYTVQGTTCRHCNENKAMNGYNLCSFCNQVCVRLSEAIRQKRITRYQRHALWKASKGSLHKTRELRDVLRIRMSGSTSGRIHAVLIPSKEPAA